MEGLGEGAGLDEGGEVGEDALGLVVVLGEAEGAVRQELGYAEQD